MRTAFLLFFWALFNSVCATQLGRSLVRVGRPLANLRHSATWRTPKDSPLLVFPTPYFVLVKNDHYSVRVKLHSDNTLSALQTGCCIGVFREGVLQKEVGTMEAGDEIVVFMSREKLSDELSSKTMLRSQIKAFAEHGFAKRSPYGDYVIWKIDSITE